MSPNRIVISSVALGVLCCAAAAQGPTQSEKKPPPPTFAPGGPKPLPQAPTFNGKPVQKEGPGLHMETNLGSFKIKRGSEDPDLGDLTMTFQGTVLVSGLKGAVETGGTVHLEYDRPDVGKKVYFGKGTLHVNGQFQAIQFFGQDMKALYYGSGIIQLAGEFDKNLDTGTYWYGNEVKNKHYWGTNPIPITPSPQGQEAQQNTPIKIKKIPPSKAKS